RHRLRPPRGAGRADRDDRAGLRLVVERERERAGKPPRIPQCRKRRPYGKRGIRQARGDVEASNRIARMDGDVQMVGRPGDDRVAAMIVVMREKVPARDHRPAVRIAAENAKAAAGPSAIRTEPGKYPIAGEEEILPASSREPGGPKRSGL